MDQENRSMVAENCESNEGSELVTAEDAMLISVLRTKVRQEVGKRSRAGYPKGSCNGKLLDWQLQRFYSLLSQGNLALKGVFTEEELGMMADCLNGFGFDSEGLAEGVVFGLQDKIGFYPEHFAELGIDTKSLLAKVEALDTLSRYALVDVVERWWGMSNSGMRPSITSLIEDTTEPRHFIHITL